MPTPILELVCRALDDPRLKDCPDGQLLRRFVADRDAAAFEALVRRHGPMVLDVCRGLLPNESDAEDAFQATFLVLARKAGSVRKARSLASWLHGVAARVARRAQTAFARRRKHEPRAAGRPAPARADDLTWAEVRQVLHEELNALPDRLRGPLILCYLEGATQDEAAAELGLPKGTLKGRLERGREVLRARLIRRGLGAAALLASAWPVASVSAALADSAVKVATGSDAGQAAHVSALAGEVLRAMSLTTVRTAVLAVVVTVCAGAGAFALHASAVPPAGEDPAAVEHAGRTPARTEAPKEGPSRLADPQDEGTWVKSDDGVLALWLAAGAKQVEVKEPIVLVASLKNLSDKPVNVLRPFGDDYKAASSGIELLGPQGAIRYSGPNKEYVLGSAAFFTLGPGEVVSDRLSLSVDQREGSDLAGNYRVTFTYRADDGDRATAKGYKFADLWVGRITSGTVTVRKVDPKLDDKQPPPKEPEWVKAVFDPEDERIKGFVATLERGGVKLAPEKDNRTGKWRVVEPKTPGGTVFVDLCTFDAPASEEQMHAALNHFNWGWHYKNAPARLAMSLGTPLRKGFEQGVPDEVSAVEEKLRICFFWHKRDKPPAERLTNETLNTGAQNHKDERIQALVDYLGRKGIKLTPDGRGEWQIDDPGHTDGKMLAHIRSFPQAASEEQMRWALRTIALAYQVNAPAHLAMSYVSLRGAEKGKTPAVEAFEKKLFRLFHEYAPASLAAHTAAGELPEAGVKEVNAVREFLKSRGIELARAENSSNLIQYLFTVGPDRDKRLCIGLGYLPPAKADEMKQRYRDSGIPHVFRGNVVLFKVGAPNGPDTKEFAAVWEKVEAAFKAYPAPEKAPDK